MPVTISIPAPLRQFAGGQSQLVVEANTAGEALDRLTSAHAALRRHLFNDQNVLRNFVNVYLNDEDIRHASGPDTPVKDGEGMSSGRHSMGARRSRAVAIETVASFGAACNLRTASYSAACCETKAGLPSSLSRLVATGTARLASSTWMTGSL